MNGEQFKELDIEQQVNYVNELLKEGDSVDNIRLTLGIGKNFIATTFKNNGYKLNRNINQYVSVATVTINVAQTNKKPIEKPKNITNINTEDDKYKALETEIEGLKLQIKDIYKLLDKIQDNNVTTNVATDTTSILHSCIDSYDTKDTVNRNYRIYNDIQEEFATFCKEHRQYKVQDIVSSAIKEYLDKYN